MNCEEVSKHLTEYLDKTLDMSTTTRVATHIISCALCRAESSEIADCIQQVAALPALDPPLGFAQRVMVHVHDMEPKMSLWQRLIGSFTIHMPVRATALSVVAICAIVLYQKEQPLNQSNDVNLALRRQVQAPLQEPEPTTISTFKESTVVTNNGTSGKLPAAAVPVKTEAQSQPTRATILAAPNQLAQGSAAGQLRSENKIAEEETITAPKRPPLRVQEVTASREIPMIGDTRGFSVPLPAPLAALRQTSTRPTTAALERAIPIGDRVTDFEFTVRRHAPVRRDQVGSVGAADSLQKSSDADSASLAASRSSTPAAPARAKIESIAEIRYYNVAPEHFDIFRKELAAEANIESEPKVVMKELEAARQADRQLLIKVTILPAEQSSSSR
jgi:hypothetical protein